MGRVVQSDRLVIGSSPRQRIVIIAAARSIGVSEDDMRDKIQVGVVKLLLLERFTLRWGGVVCGGGGGGGVTLHQRMYG
jgi:hypothetical protein